MRSLRVLIESLNPAISSQDAVQLGKHALKRRLDNMKGATLNGAQNSVLNDLFRVLESQEHVSYRLQSQNRPEDLSRDHAAIEQRGRKSSDEAYIVDLHDEMLGTVALRQYRAFDFLLGDGRRRVRLPVDAYYSTLGLVIEYREKQHYEEVPFFDKQYRLTVSGVHRGEQRRLYDERRRSLLPEHEIGLIEVPYLMFSHNRNGRLLRDRESDLDALRHIPALKGLSFGEHALTVSLADGRTITVPLAWYPRLLHATPEQRERWQVSGGGYGIHWPDLDEDLSVEGLLAGRRSGESQRSFKRWLEERASNESGP